MAGGAHNITKIGIIVVSVILGFFSALKLYTMATDGRDIGNTDKILDIIVMGMCFTLCILAFWGAFSENACLCYIALLATIIILVVAIWQLIHCFLKDGNCDTMQYIVRTIIIVVLGVMVIAVYSFIQAIK